jgi:putative transcriptional regulator
MKKQLFSHWRSKIAGTLAGKILIAHPMLEEQEFTKTMLFIDFDNGQRVTGVILNQPLNVMLKALGKNFENLPISNIPVYHGGQEEYSTMMLTAWVFDEDKRAFEIYYTLNNDEAEELMKTKKNIQFRAFLGLCSFDQRVYSDIEKGLWIVGDPKKLFGAQEHGVALWQSILLKENPNALVYG